MMSMTSTPLPGTYTKGDSTKVADTARDAVALVYDGYSRVDTSEVETGSSDEVETPADPSPEAPVVDDDNSDAPADENSTRSPFDF
jgi:hypothetical protein